MVKMFMVNMARVIMVRVRVVKMVILWMMKMIMVSDDDLYSEDDVTNHGGVMR